MTSQSKIQSIFNRFSLPNQVAFRERVLFFILVILIINTVMLFNGFSEDIGELSRLIAEGNFLELILFNLLNFLVSPSLSEQCLVGLCWLIFLIFPVRRSAVLLSKTAFSFCETLQSFISLNYHGSRAPPRFIG